MFDSHHDIYTINNAYKPNINILTEIENRSCLLLQVGDIQRLVRPCPLQEIKKKYKNIEN